MSVDARSTLVLEGLADDRLQGVLRADRFTSVSQRQTISPIVAVRRAPDAAAEQVDQILFGELFDVLETRAGFAFGQAVRDGYVGWVDLTALSDVILTPTHWVAAPSTLAFTEASIKAPATGPIPLNALLAISAEAETMLRDRRLGWAPAAHLRPIGVLLGDPAAVALAHLGAPYLWGGRSGGLDCSGLVQQALLACGHACPRDADQQQALGRPTPADSLGRGDLVFWRGHVAMMIDSKRMVHANAFHMAVAVEPLERARARIAAGGGGEPIAYRRVGV